MNKTARGALIFLGIIISSAVFCYWVPFVFLPGQGIGMALPVIVVAGETLIPNFFGEGVHLTNTMVGTLAADVVVLLMLLAIYLGGGIKAVPGRLQGLLEFLVGYMYDLAKSVAGSRAGRIFPLAMGIFFFLLIANWLELVPGVDSVGLLHCAEPGLSGYPANVEEGEPLEGWVSLRVERGLDSGTKATEADFCGCEAVNVGHFPEGEETECLHALEEAGVVLPGDMEGGEHEEAATEGEGGEGEAAAAEEGGEDHGISEELVVAVNEAAEAGQLNPNLFVVTSFVRAAATDLSLTLALAILVVVAVQVYGVWAQGPDYFQKFINLRALGGMASKPMGAMDFVVGFLEIISELSRILSFAFRLFGNIFGGQVLIFVIAFLVATLLPAFVYGFELFVGVIQAFVFAMLTLVFSAQAMEGHGDEQH